MGLIDSLVTIAYRGITAEFVTLCRELFHATHISTIGLPLPFIQTLQRCQTPTATGIDVDTEAID